MRHPSKAFPDDLENRLRKACAGDPIGLMFLLSRDEQIIDTVRSYSHVACAQWQTIINMRLEGHCNIEGCSGEDEYGNEDGSYHEQHIDSAVTRRDQVKTYYDRLIIDLDAIFDKWRIESLVPS